MSGPADLFAELSWRGLIHQTTDDAQLPSWLQSGARTVYAGFDPTADSLHVGHLVAVLMLRRFQRAGHRPIAVVGGATGMIGDPSGRNDERNLLSEDALQANVAALREQLKNFLDFERSTRPALLVNNYDWMKGFSFLSFLRDIGKHFPVNVMLSKDSVKNRLERTDSGLSYTEFSYMLLQAYDFVILNREHGCELQLGGSDQWGNITAGIDLARRLHGASLFGLTTPLLTKSDGTKMGKTAQGAVWLSPARTSPYAFYQYWFRVEDADVGKCLRFFTDLSREELTALDESRTADAGRRDSQRTLAELMTRMVHGESGLARAQKATQVFFGGEMEEFTEAELLDIFAEVPSREVPRERLTGTGLGLLDALVEAGLAKSKGEARRLVQQGGANLNNRRAANAEQQLTEADLGGRSILVLRQGKKNYALLKFVG